MEIVERSVSASPPASSMVSDRARAAFSAAVSYTHLKFVKARATAVITAIIAIAGSDTPPSKLRAGVQ